MIYILYSADYEVYLGSNFFSEEDVLIQPADNLLNTCNRLGVPITLFADTCCFQRYRESGLDDFPDAVDEQLKDAVCDGHDVQAHVHPHWLSTTINEEGYAPDVTRFLLGNLSADIEDCFRISSKILSNCRSYLNKTLASVNRSYRCIAFRAGGYGIQPNSDLIARALRSEGFLIDSSVVPYLTLKTSVNDIDFQTIPQRANYWLSEAGAFSSFDSGDGVFEIPIASTTINFPERVFLRIVREARHINNPKKGGIVVRGMSIQDLAGTPARESGFERYHRIFKTSVEHMDVMPDPYKMFYITQKYLKTFAPAREDVFFSVNCHPKMMGEHHLSALIGYHNLMLQKYEGEICPITFQDAAEILENEGRVCKPDEYA